MNTVQQIAKHFREVYFGSNWTDVNLKDALAGVTWQQAIAQVHDLNTIATLVFHINYYVNPQLEVLQGNPLQASDKYSFDLPPITNEADWQELVAKVFREATLFAEQVEKLPESKLHEDFADPTYGSYYRNLLGIIEHTYYHLGQIVLIKKLLNIK
ncbi:MAG TPA: DUF1572 domain-containing protein [Saprospiraceae bacterium]|nr:DUF1572 domain-containing protein [Saprospiraceae bacterium]HMP14734.1 DUF1572 domain-containing protein [Saprospiraceae bacterium]